MMSERNIGFKIDSELYKEIKMKVVREETTIKDYILSLIKKDLEAEKK